MGSKVKTRVLPNGLTLIGEEMPGVQGVSLVLLAKTGARDEVQGQFGISHFLEHMVFKGTSSFSAMEHTLALGNIGAQINAYTSDEQTVYYGTVVHERFSELHRLLFEMARPSLLQSEFDVEKNVILEEIALYQDRPGHVLYQSAVENYFDGSSLGNSVLGTSESVSAITRDGMEQYLMDRYAHENLIVVVTGNFSWDEFVSLSEIESARWAKADLSNREGGLSKEGLQPRSEVQKEPARFSHPKSVQSQILLFAPGPSSVSVFRHSALVTSTLLGASHNSRLYWSLVESGIAEYASVDCEEKRDVGVVMVNCATLPDRVPQVLKILEEELSVSGALREDEVEISKTKIRSRLVMDHELSLGRAMAHAINFQYRNEPFSLASELDSLTRVDLASCIEFTEAFPLAPYRTYIMGPSGGP